jgi:hypothetical protein
LGKRRWRETERAREEREEESTAPDRGRVQQKDVVGTGLCLLVEMALSAWLYESWLKPL